MSVACISIPLQHPVEPNLNTVDVGIDELPDVPVETVLQILKDEGCVKSDIYFQFAVSAALPTPSEGGGGYPSPPHPPQVQYKKLGNSDAFAKLLDAAAALPFPSSFNSKLDRIRVLNAQASVSVSLGVLASSQRDAEEHYARANDLFTSCDQIDQFSPTTWIGKAACILAKEVNAKEVDPQAIQRAKFHFDNAQNNLGPILPCLLGHAALSLLNKDYASARDKYGEAIALHPILSGGASRLGFGLCCAALGDVDRARKAVDRAFALDANFLPTVVAKAILEMQAADEASPEGKESIERCIRQLSTAPTDAVVMGGAFAMLQNQLANHHFFAWSALKGEATATNGDREVTLSRVVDVAEGDFVQLGDDFESRLVAVGVNGSGGSGSGSGGGMTIKLDRPFSGPSSSSSSSSSSSTTTTLTLKKRDFGKVADLAKIAHESTKVLAIQCESYYLNGRVLHVRGDYDRALRSYERAATLDADFPPVQFGLAQLLLQRGDLARAAEALKKVLSAMPDCPEPLGLLGLLEARNTAAPLVRESGLKRLTHATAVDPDNWEGFVRLGLALQIEVKDFGEALKAYECAVALFDQAAKADTSMAAAGCPPAVLSNLGALYLYKKRYGDAETVFNRALKNLVGGREAAGDYAGAMRSGGPTAVSVCFNIARLLEDKGDRGEAAKVHRAIIELHPNYLASYLRMACISRDAGDLQNCAEWLKEAAKVTVAAGNSADTGGSSSSSDELLALIGNLRMSNREWKSAQGLFEKLLAEKAESMGAYSSIALGNIFFANINVSSNPEKRTKMLNYASDYFKSTLKKDKTNLYAANGLGCVIAEYGDFGKAKDIFVRVRESSGDTIGCVLTNLAHVYLAQGKHAEAIKNYEIGLQRFYNGENVALYVLIAHAYFDWAKAADEGDAVEAEALDERFRSCADWLKKGLKGGGGEGGGGADDDFEDDEIRYNLGVCLLEHAVAIWNKPNKNRRRTLANAQEAERNVQEAKTMFEELEKKVGAGAEKEKEGAEKEKEGGGGEDKEGEGKKKPKFTEKQVKERLEYCRRSISHAVEFREYEEQRHEEELKEDRRLADRASENSAKIDEIRALEEKKKNDERVEKQRIAQENSDKASRLYEQLKFVSKAAGKKSGGAGKKKKEVEGEDMMVDDDDSSDSSSDEGANVKANGRQEEGESNGKAAVDVSGLFGDDDDDDDEEEVEFGKAGEGEGKGKVTGLFDSDDSEDEAAPTAAKKRKVLDDDDDDDDE